jgi:hypothetical protein
MADFFFFTDIDLLQNQLSTQAYGPAGTTSGIEKFRVSSMHSTTSSSNAYAVCDGIVCIQPDTTNSSLVNLILKPTQNSEINYSTIKYIIYKGILKSSLLDGAGNIAIDPTNNLTESIKRSWDAYIAESGETPSLASEKSLGIDLTGTITNYADTDPIDNLFYSTGSSFHFPSVNGGWVIGKFGTSSIGLMIITERIGYNPKLKLARNNETFIEVPQLPGTPTSAQTFEYWHKKEEILNFIDPCAFYGMFYPISLNAKTSTGSFIKHQKNEIYDNILKGVHHTLLTNGNFFRRNTIYLDIRNEHNQSFDYYKNYGTDIEISLDDAVSPSVTNYYQSTWPLYIIPNSQFPIGNTTNKNEICITLPIGDNPSPIAIILNGYLKRFNPFRKLKGRKRFIDLDVNGSFTEKFKLLVPNRDSLSDTTAICHQVLIIYNKRLNKEDVPQVSGGTKIETNYYFDNAFVPLEMKSPLNNSNGIDIKVYNDNTYVCQPETEREFLSFTGIAKNSLGVFYFLYATERRNKIVSFNKKYFSFTNENNDFSNYFTDLINKKFPQISFQKSFVTVGTDDIQLISNEISIENFTDKFSVQRPSELVLFFLEDSEINTVLNLINTSNFSNNYKVFLAFGNSETFYDKNNKPYISSDLLLKGFIENAGIINATDVNTNIKVYQYVS